MIDYLYIEGLIKQAVEAVRYMEHCVNTLGSNDQAVHNYLLALYVKVMPDKLLPYLERQGKVKVKKLGYGTFIAGIIIIYLEAFTIVIILRMLQRLVMI